MSKLKIDRCLMEKQEEDEQKQPIVFKLLISMIIILGLISFSLCITAEFKKAKKDDLRFENELCYLPKSSAFSLGIATLVLLIIAQISGNLLVCNKFLPGSISWKIKQPPPLGTIFLIFSWISFGVGVILMSTATSMSQNQELGEGWVNGECYIVKDGIFIGSSLMILITVCLISSSAILMMRKRQVEQGRKVHS